MTSVGYDREVRPHLMQVAIAELQETGVEADVWKIEGIDDPEQCAQDRRAVPDRRARHVACVVLGSWCR